MFLGSVLSNPTVTHKFLSDPVKEVRKIPAPARSKAPAEAPSDADKKESVIIHSPKSPAVVRKKNTEADVLFTCHVV